jgi:deoxyribose-phosphate aldolase
MSQRSVAARALALVDLTDLSDGLDTAGTAALCARARTAHGAVAAVCLWPAFVAQAKAALAGSGIRVATVVNFPRGAEDTRSVVAETAKAVADGADEVDLVLPYRTLMAGRAGFAETQIARVRAACPSPVRLKVILETGMIVDPGLIRQASDVAIAAGADFIKTSTGKVAVNATLAATQIMLDAIRASGRPVGLKPSGGIRTLADAAAYLAQADAMMGPGWVTPDTFRFGASGLLSDLIAHLDGAAPTATPPGSGY